MAYKKIIPKCVSSKIGPSNVRALPLGDTGVLVRFLSHPINLSLGSEILQTHTCAPTISPRGDGGTSDHVKHLQTGSKDTRIHEQKFIIVHNPFYCNQCWIKFPCNYRGWKRHYKWNPGVARYLFYRNIKISSVYKYIQVFCIINS